MLLFALLDDVDQNMTFARIQDEINSLKLESSVTITRYVMVMVVMVMAQQDVVWMSIIEMSGIMYRVLTYIT